MSILYQGAYVDEKYGSKFVETLFENNWLIDGVTYTSDYNNGSTDAGSFIFLKQNASNNNGPETVGANYNKHKYSNTRIAIDLLNQYSETDEIPRATVAATAPSVIENTIKIHAKKIATRQMRSALACLITESGHKDFGKSALTKDNITDRILAAATEGVDEYGDIDTILMPPKNYAMLVGVLPKTQITPTANEETVRNGLRLKSMNWSGINIYAVPGLTNGESLPYSYITRSNNTETTKTVEASTIKDVNFIAYNHNAFAMMTLLDFVGAYDSHDFPGVQINSVATNGFGLIYPEHVIIDTASAGT